MRARIVMAHVHGGSFRRPEPGGQLGLVRRETVCLHAGRMLLPEIAHRKSQAAAWPADIRDPAPSPAFGGFEPAAPCLGPLGHQVMVS